jgi:hypothetical protein
MVRQGDPGEPRTRPRQGRVHGPEPTRHRPLAEALGRAQFCAQIAAAALGTVDADLLYQPRRVQPRKTLEAAKDELRKLFGKKKAQPG